MQKTIAIVVIMVTLSSSGFVVVVFMTSEDDRMINICRCLPRSVLQRSGCAFEVSTKLVAVVAEASALAVTGPLTAFLLTRATSGHLFHIALFALCSWAGGLAGVGSSLQSIGYCSGSLFEDIGTVFSGIATMWVFGLVLARLSSLQRALIKDIGAKRFRLFLKLFALFAVMLQIWRQFIFTPYDAYAMGAIRLVLCFVLAPVGLPIAWNAFVVTLRLLRQVRITAIP